MSTPRKLILSAGLGRFASFDANAQANFGADAGAKAREQLSISIEKAREAGFELVTVDIDPRDPRDSLARFLDELKGREFVGVNIGYGLRGHKEHTELFEKMLNQALVVRPGVKIMFSNGPQEVITAIQRNFPEAF